MRKRKNNIQRNSILLICATCILVGILGGFILYNNASKNKEQKDLTTDNKKTNNTEKNLNLEDFIGMWFENEANSKIQNSNYLYIKSINNNTLTANLYITRTAEFENISIPIKNNKGNFEALTENGLSTDNNPAKITGHITIDNNLITLIITKSNVKGLTAPIQYKFTYANKNYQTNETKEETNTNNTPKDNKKNDINLTNYIGSWYKDEDYSKGRNPDNLKIKNYSNNTLVADLYISRTVQLDDLNIKMNNNTGTFEVTSDYGPTVDDKEAKIKGKIEINKNVITLTITESNLKYLKSNEQFIFNYQIKNKYIDNYKGTWYEDESYAKGRNPNSITIKEIKGNEVTFSFYITRTATFNDTKVYLTENYGTFKSTTNDGPTKDNKIGEATGTITLKDNQIKLYISKTNMSYLDTGKEYTFTYKQ